MYKLSKTLIQKSQESFLLALELYNKPTVGYRAESFSILFSNAWELMLKANLLEQTNGKRNAIFRRKQRNRRRESISLDEALNKIFFNASDPVRKNIEYISGIRNEAAHLIIEELNPYFSRAFQVGVINYIGHLLSWFGIDLNERLNPGLLSLISDKSRITDMAVLKSRYSKEDFQAILNSIERFEELQKLGDRAALSIQHTVAIVKNPKKADYVISAGESGTQGVAVIQRVRDPDMSHPFSRKRAISEIKKSLTKHIKFNEYDFEAYVFVKGHKKTNNNEYHYKGRFSGSSQYSQRLIDECIQEINTDSDVLMQKIEAKPAALLVQSRTQQKSFLFLLEEKIRRAQIRKSEENFFAGWRAIASGGGLASLVGFPFVVGSRKVYNYSTTSVDIFPLV